ncbi:MAG: ribosome biogenesis GTP-binding protein YihA/YsxC [Chitinophagaceae bacterium]|jgi:GTP-binding protein|nr:ribosome biogenesis GTP-binding protein YihA/YsxC [Chitinophagaceae bacterium]
MVIKKAEYLISSPSLAQCPKPDRPEYAFLGRSNVGKSSLINMITGQKNLAKTSSAPGKTQLINHFSIEGSDMPWYLVDLPGYGFAKVSASQRRKWSAMIEEYIRKRESLGLLFLLVDARHRPQKMDIDFIAQLGEWQVPFCLVFTKADKETQRVVSQNVKAFLEEMKKSWAELPPHFVTSSEKWMGREALLRLIGEMNQAYAREKTGKT